MVLNGFSVGAGVFAGSAFSIRFGVASSFASVSFCAPDFRVGVLSGSGVGLFLAPGFFVGSEDSFDSAFSDRFGFGVASFSFSLDFFVPGFALLFGVGDSSGSGIGLFLAPGPFAGSGDSPDSVFAVGFGLGVAPSSPSSNFLAPDFTLLFGAGDSLASGVGLFLAAGVAVGVGFGSFLDLDFRFAGFGFAFGSGVSADAGEAVARISSRALMRTSRFFLSSSVSCALTKVATIAPSARVVPRITRKRITAGERNRDEGLINSRKLSGQAGCGFATAALAAPSRSRRRIAFNFPPRSKSKQVRYIQVISTIMDASAR